MRAMEEASAATTKASVEMERLMLRTQAELPATLAAVEDAALQFDRLGLEIRDSGRRFGLTNPSASSGAFAARGGVGQFNADPLFTGEPEGGTTGPPDSVSAAVGRLVEEAQQAGAAALSGAAGGDQAAVLDASLKALGEWRGRLEQVLSATRDVAGAAGAAVGGAVEDAAAAVAFRRRQDVQALADASAPSTALAERQQGADGDGSDGGGGGAFGWLRGLRKVRAAVPSLHSHLQYAHTAARSRRHGRTSGGGRIRRRGWRGGQRAGPHSPAGWQAARHHAHAAPPQLRRGRKARGASQSGGARTRAGGGGCRGGASGARPGGSSRERTHPCSRVTHSRTPRRPLVRWVASSARPPPRWPPPQRRPCCPEAQRFQTHLWTLWTMRLR